MILNLNADTPIYLQIAHMIRDAVLSGDLKAGDPIPSVRQMCTEYGINPQTILNATQVLIRENILEKHRGMGMFITGHARQALLQRESIKFTEEDIPQMLHRGQQLNMTADDICTLIKSISKKGN